MRLVRYGSIGSERPGVLDAEGRVRDATSLVGDWAGAALDPDRLAELSATDLAALPVAPGSPRLGPPVAGVGKIIGVGLNYADHAAEAGLSAPTEPVWFLKATTALCGPNDPIVIPRGAQKVDWEAELAVAIGRRASYVTEEDVPRYIAGYTVLNDVSERVFQLERGGQWTKGKSCDSFAPLGPWLATQDEIADPCRLDIWLDVNGVRQQRSNTSHLIFRVATLIATISQYMTLEAGDVIATGTPGGVGFAQSPQRFLAPGDLVELGVAGLGAQRQQVVSWTEGWRS